MARSAKEPEEIQKVSLSPGPARSAGKRAGSAKKTSGPATSAGGPSPASARQERKERKGVISVARPRPLPRTAGPSIRLEPALVAEAGPVADSEIPEPVPAPAATDRKAARLAQIRALVARRERRPLPVREDWVRFSTALTEPAPNRPGPPAAVAPATIVVPEVAANSSAADLATESLLAVERFETEAIASPQPPPIEMAPPPIEMAPPPIEMAPPPMAPPRSRWHRLRSRWHRPRSRWRLRPS